MIPQKVFYLAFRGVKLLTEKTVREEKRVLVRSATADHYDVAPAQVIKEIMGHSIDAEHVRNKWNRGILILYVNGTLLGCINLGRTDLECYSAAHEYNIDLWGSSPERPILLDRGTLELRRNLQTEFNLSSELPDGSRLVMIASVIDKKERTPRLRFSIVRT